MELKERINKLIFKSTVFGHAIDEATDIACDQSLIQYVKFIVDGRVQTLFYAMLALDAQDAETIFETDVASLAGNFDRDVE